MWLPHVDVVLVTAAVVDVVLLPAVVRVNCRVVSVVGERGCARLAVGGCWVQVAESGCPNSPEEIVDGCSPIPVGEAIGGCPSTNCFARLLFTVAQVERGGG